MPKAAWKILRSESYSEKEFRPYVTLIGQTALGWNDLHEQLGLIFWTLSGTAAAISVWQSSIVDRAKRKMLEAVVNELDENWMKNFPKAQPDIKWLLTESEKLEDARNTVVHAPLQSRSGIASVFVLMGGLTPTVSAHDRLGNPRAAKLTGKEIIQEFRWCRNSILHLRNFADGVQQGLISPRKSWPARPPMPNRGQKK